MNVYIDTFRDCFTRLNTRSYEMIYHTEEVKKLFRKPEMKKIYFESYKLSEKTVNEKIEELYKSQFGYIYSSETCNFIRSFQDMWDFCQFVRYSEKVIFYENTPDKLLYVDSGMNDEKTRSFSIINKDKNCTIKFILEKKEYDSITKNMDVITIEVLRDFGKKMTNKFTIVNREVKYNDESDIALMDSINILLYENTRLVFIDIFKKLFKFFEDYTRWEKKPYQTL